MSAILETDNTLYTCTGACTYMYTSGPMLTTQCCTSMLQAVRLDTVTKATDEVKNHLKPNPIYNASLQVSVNFREWSFRLALHQKNGHKVIVFVGFS